MKVLIAGGTGFLGRSLTRSLAGDGHEVYILTRNVSLTEGQIHWDGITTSGWGSIVNEVDAVVQLTGFGLEHWPWTRRQKQRFLDSRRLPTRALVRAIESASHRPRFFLQHSGINYYGLQGDSVADENTEVGNDYLARLSFEVEAASAPVEAFGVRRVIVRAAVVLARKEGLLPLMTLPVRLFFGGRFGAGTQSFNWIHVYDHIQVMRFLMENEITSGPYNSISPAMTSLSEFMRAVAYTLKRPYWFHLPTALMRMTLGEMSVLLTEGRFTRPRRLMEAGFSFRFDNLNNAMNNLLT